MKRKKLIIMIVVVACLILALLNFVWKPRKEKVNYKVLSVPLLYPYSDAVFDKKTKTIIAYVNINCASHITVEKEGSTYRIIEELPWWGAYTCSESEIVLIFNASENAQLEFVNSHGVTPMNIKVNTFCGWTAYQLTPKECKSDKECAESGRYGEVCHPATSPDMFKNMGYGHLGCFDNKYNVKCGCVNGMCQWVSK